MAFLDDTGVQNLTSDIKTLADQTYLPKTTTIPAAGTSVPVAGSNDGNVGTSIKYAREDHSHPLPKYGNIVSFNIEEVTT